MDRMNPLDASFLYIENGTTHMTIASCARFEAPAPTREELLAMFAAKLPLVPRYRQRVRFVPFDLGRPVWVDDPTFNLEYHLRWCAVPSPGGEAELEELMGRLMSDELDRSRPLWETWMVEGLADGTWALISKVHHCMVDGVAGVDLISVVLDPTPEPSGAVEDTWQPEPEPSNFRLARDAAVSLATSPAAPARVIVNAIRDPRQTARQLRDLVGGFRYLGSALRATPPTSLDGAIGAHRRWTAARVPLDDVKRIRRVLGGTVNDVVLSVIASGFRDLALARGEDPSNVVLRSLVPVSVRDDSAHGVYDNRVSAIFFDLPVHIADPVERLGFVREEMARMKQSHEPEAGEALTAIIGAVPSTIGAEFVRLMSRLSARGPQRSMNTVTTNVPGPPAALYAAGRKMIEYLPYVPLGPGVRIGVAILSYNGQLAFGVTGDFDSAPDISVVATGIERAVQTLLMLADEREPAPTKRIA